METFVYWLIVLVGLLMAFSLSLFFLHKAHQLQILQMNQQFSAQMALQARLSGSQNQLSADLVDKAMALVASADPLAYQAIQAMAQTPSVYDDAEGSDPTGSSRAGDEVSGYEQDFINSIFDAPGNEYWPVPDTDPAPSP